MSGKVSRAGLYDLLNAYEVPSTGSTLLGLKAVKGIEVEGGAVTLNLQLPESMKDLEATVRENLERAVGHQPNVTSVCIHVTWQAAPQVEVRNLLTSVKHTVVVGSGKGGVGKSTVAVNLACAAAKQGLRVGLLDADIYGPSMAMMFGISDSPYATPDGKIAPLEKFGLKLMSMAFLIDEDRPVIWRGPMLNKALQQFLGDVAWGELDLLVIDLPPGTGDVQITLMQNAKIDGAIVVSTPQDVAFLDAKKAIGLFHTAKIPVVGVVENMSRFLCPHCGEETQIFGHGGVRAATVRMGLPFLGEIPIDLAIREGGDQGHPLVVQHPQSPQSEGFMDMAERLKIQLGL